MDIEEIQKILFRSTTVCSSPFDFEKFSEQATTFMEQNSSYFGLRIVTDVSLGKMVQARTHKKKRINKKWRKRFGFKSVPDGDKVYVIPPAGVILMHPGTYEKLKKSAKNITQKEVLF